MTTEQPLWFIVYHLFDIKHYPLITPAMAKGLHRLDERLFQGEWWVRRTRRMVSRVMVVFC